MTPFEIAKQRRLDKEKENQQKEEEKKNRQYSRDYEEITWTGMEKESKVFRILGLPVEVRENPTDAKIVYWSKIVNDTGKSWINIYFPQTVDYEIDKDWILYRLHQKVNETRWIYYKEGEIRDPNKPRSTEKGYFNLLHEKTFSYKRINENKKENSNQFGHFYPKKRVLLNVIDRMDNWCKENKHSKILTSNLSPFEITDETTNSKKIIWFNDVGMPNEFYKFLYSQVIEFRNTWDLDLIVHKEDKKYIIRDAFEEKIDQRVKSLVNGNPLTKEESEYEKYDLDKLFKPTGYYKLMNGLEKLFKQVDIDLGTKFFDELNHLYQEEKSQREKEQKNSTTTQTSVSENISSEQPLTRKRGDSKSVEDKLKEFPGWNNLTQMDKDEMLKWTTDVNGDNFSYKEGVSLVSCSCEKKIKFPDSVWHCPIDGCKFE